MYFIEGDYLYTLVGSSGRGERTSERGATGARQSGVPVQVKGTLERRALRALVIGGGYCRRKPDNTQIYNTNT